MRKKTTSGKPVLGQYVLNQKKEKWFQLCELYAYASEKANFKLCATKLLVLRWHMDERYQELD